MLAPGEGELMRTRTHPRFAAVALATGLLCACGKSEPATGGPTKGAPAESLAAQAPGPAEDAKLAGVLAPYEQIRAALADDALDRVAEPAAALASAAGAGASQATGGTGRILTELSSAASKLQQTDKSNAEAVRKDFGEVSRAFVALLRAEPTLRAGRHLFHCPMAQGFPKWVQPSDALANPYMGKQMLRCGAPNDWE